MLEKRQEHWKGLAVGYLILAAMGAMMFVVVALLDLLGVNEAKQWNGWMALASLVITGVGAIFLLVELGNKPKFILVFSNPSSIMTIGAYALTLFMIADFIYATFFFDFIPWSGLSGLKDFFAILGIVAALLLVTYPGIELGEARGRRFWNGSALVPLFLISATATGVACVILAFVILGQGAADVIKVLDFTLLGLVIILPLMVGSYLLGMKHSGQVGAERAVAIILHGYYETAFYGGFLLIGTVLSLATYLGGFIPSMLAIKSVAVLIGGACLRNIFLGAAVQTGVPGEEREWYEEKELKYLAKRLDRRWQEKEKWLNPPQT